MKKLLLFAMALVGTMLAHAQDSETRSATLQSGETTTVFSGADAFRNALEAAEDGSIITLSSGTFNGTGIFVKSVKVYGAGFQDDEKTGVKCTKVLGSVDVRGNENNENKYPNGLYFEGVWFTGGVAIQNPSAPAEVMTGLQFVKCRTGGFDFYGITNSTLLLQSFIEGKLNGRDQTATNLLVQNCIVTQHVGGFGGASDVLVDHCMLTRDNAGAYDQYHGPYRFRSTLVNCYLPGGATEEYCFGAKWYVTGAGTRTGGYYLGEDFESWATLFKDGQNDLSYTIKETGAPRTWELAEPEKFVGGDGTPVGVIGGEYPWNPIPSTPRIVSSSIDSKSVAGKLKVNIKAEARPANK